MRAAAPLRELHRTGLARPRSPRSSARCASRTATATLAPLDAVADGTCHPCEGAPPSLALPPNAVHTGPGARPRPCRARGRPPGRGARWLRRERAWWPVRELLPPSHSCWPGRCGRSRRRSRSRGPERPARVTAEQPAIHAAALTERAHFADDFGLGLHHERCCIRSAHGLLLGCIDSLEAIAAALAGADGRGVAAVLAGAPPGPAPSTATTATRRPRRASRGRSAGARDDLPGAIASHSGRASRVAARRPAWTAYADGAVGRGTRGAGPEQPGHRCSALCQPRHGQDAPAHVYAKLGVSTDRPHPLVTLRAVR